ncbi:jg7743, partial [Pararge aegeria aegeria]
MKVFVTLLAVLALGYSAPQTRHQFHDHYEEFLNIIADEAREDLDELTATYMQFEEFQAGIEYLMSPRFRNLVYEMEDLPEFKSMVEFMETHNIDILYFINEINEAV